MPHNKRLRLSVLSRQTRKAFRAVCTVTFGLLLALVPGLFIALVLALFSGCASQTRQDLFPFPATESDLDPETVETARQAWLDQGFPDPKDCEPMKMWTVSFSDLEKKCGYPACLQPGVTGLCSYACSDGFIENLPTMFYSAAPEHSLAIEQAHELMHTWTYCLLGDPTADAGHFRGTIWVDAMSEVGDEVGASYRTGLSSVRSDPVQDSL